MVNSKPPSFPRSKQYEEEIARDFSILFLAASVPGVCPMISERLIGRRISPTEISSVNKELNDAVEVGGGGIYRRSRSSTVY